MDGSAASLEGRLALVTGGSGGIGLGVARLLGQRGAQVLLVARGRARLERLAEELGAEAIAGDVSDAAFVAALGSRLREGGRSADIVVHAAGRFELAPVASTSIESFDRALAVNLRAPFLLAREFLPGMIERGRGHILSIGSIAGRRGLAHNAAYSASKFGVRGLHAVLDVELRGTGVRSTLIEPAATDTSLWDEVDETAHPGLPSRSAMLRPAAVAEAVLFALTCPPDVAVRNVILERY